MRTDLHLRSASFALLSLLSSVFTAGAQTIDDDLPLPRWDQRPPLVNGAPVPLGPGSQFNSLLPGESLVPSLPEDPGALQFGPRLMDTPSSLNPQFGATDLSLFLPGSLLQQARPAQTPRVPTPVMALKDLPADIIASLDDSPANDYLIDPQNLVPEIARADIERLLEFHNSDARIRLHILVLDADQKLPDTLDPATIAHGALGRQHSCLAIYPLGEPWRARVLLSRPLHAAAKPDMLMDMVADCIRDAQEADEPMEQFHRYTVRLSTRLFWLQKSIPTTPASQAASPTLREVTAGGESPAPLYLWLNSPVTKIVLSGIAVLGLGWLLLRKVIKPRLARQAGSEVWMLPEHETKARLGGAFSAGAGAALSYKKV
ncbi:hypothetical protein [Brevifollis gellanilyticus]|uniref:TPM domain-containing protein n=1 Tax=Brevifollis gellanilyticus TaxID=748831 RepID=A0A512M850_9BACT|nr:hypothetical protein [Brevifollis gellanilyticus]GEP42908.1 hypothetical protein BGE01nite_21990 [Brevifollis gellanilyticus]